MLIRSPLEGSTLPLSGNPGAAANCSLVGSSKASASAVLDEISGPVVSSLSALTVAVSFSFGVGLDLELELELEADRGEVVDIVLVLALDDLGIGGSSCDASADDNLATSVVLSLSIYVPRNIV